MVLRLTSSTLLLMVVFASVSFSSEYCSMVPGGLTLLCMNDPSPALASALITTASSDDSFSPEIRHELKSAKGLAQGGAVVYGLGMAVQVVGAAIFMNDLVAWQEEDDYDPYSGSSSSRSDAPPMGGLFIAIGGSLGSFIGSVMSNFGGSNARDALRASSYSTTPFKGWQYFWTGVAFNAGGSLLSSAGLPVIPAVLSIAGFAFNVSSIVHSVRYANNAYLHSVVFTNPKVYPTVSLGEKNSVGMVFSADLCVGR